MTGGTSFALGDPRKVQVANVFKSGELAATLQRVDGGAVEFRYLPGYDPRGAAVAFSLPTDSGAFRTPSGSVPPFFAGLLPEGYRLTALKQHIKVSANDELSLLVTVGADTPGDVQVLPAGVQIDDSASLPAPAVRDTTGNYDSSEVRKTLDLHSIPGVQDKVSAQMITAPVSDRFSHSILKLNPEAYPGLVENEFAHLQAARKLGLPVAEAQLVEDKYGERGLLVGRFDRVAGDSPRSLQRLALEDATQILGLTPAQKYNVSAEEVVEAVSDLASAGMVARRNLFMQFLFAWLTGNGDLHAKNVSLLSSQGRWAVVPAYDVPSTLIYRDNTMALDIDGRRSRLRWRNWKTFGRTIGLPDRAILSAAIKARNAAASVDWQSLPFEGSPVRGTLRELRFRQSELPDA